MFRALSRRTLAIALAIGVLVAMQPTPALADPGGTGKPSANGSALQENTPLTVSFKGAKNGGIQAFAASCWGFSNGASNNPSSAYGSSYNDCTGNVVSQNADVHLIWCVSTIGGGCLPWVDLGTMTNGRRTLLGPGGFWTPASGNATMGGLTPGYSFMVRTNLFVVLTDGSTGTGWSSSSIFKTPMP